MNDAGSELIPVDRREVESRTAQQKRNNDERISTLFYYMYKHVILISKRRVLF